GRPRNRRACACIPAGGRAVAPRSRTHGARAVASRACRRAGAARACCRTGACRNTRARGLARASPHANARPCRALHAGWLQSSGRPISQAAAERPRGAPADGARRGPTDRDHPPTRGRLVTVAAAPTQRGGATAGDAAIAAAARGPASEACPLCGAPLHPEQEWCLNCGAAARTRLAATPNWKVPIAVLARVAALSLGVLAAALVKLTGSSGSTSTAVTRTVTTAPTATTTPAPRRATAPARRAAHRPRPPPPAPPPPPPPRPPPPPPRHDNAGHRHSRH